MSLARLGTKYNCAGEDQQQFTLPDTYDYPYYYYYYYYYYFVETESSESTSAIHSMFSNTFPLLIRV
jgi:hypothetical protein